MLIFAKAGHEIDDLNAISEAGPAEDASQVSVRDPELRYSVLLTTMSLIKRQLPIEVHTPYR
jgi:hypothetical protein